MKRELVLGSGRDLGTIGLVAALCGLYAGVLVSASAVLATLGDDTGNLAFTLQIASLVFNLVAIYVAAVVITNAIDTVLAGRLQQLALLRLLGARSTDLRRVVMRSTGLIGLVAALGGAALGVAITAAARVVLVARGTLPSRDYPLTSVVLIVPIAVVAVVALICGWRGSRRVLSVTPAEAMTGVSAPAASPGGSRDCGRSSPCW
ncbi:FtsX-like permease family protein [Branchiibius cervicis]|uniref:FtsX-like permease family protein n=1 Tax=Branchiibius cervicis TaxID=908252 RepID=A0ABW2AXV5_9MICO